MPISAGKTPGSSPGPAWRKVRVCHVMASANSTRTAPITASFMRTRASFRLPGVRRPSWRCPPPSLTLPSAPLLSAMYSRKPPDRATPKPRCAMITELLAVVDLLQHRRQDVDHLLRQVRRAGDAAPGGNGPVEARRLLERRDVGEGGLRSALMAARLFTRPPRAAPALPAPSRSRCRRRRRPDPADRAPRLGSAPTAPRGVDPLPPAYQRAPDARCHPDRCPRPVPGLALTASSTAWAVSHSLSERTCGPAGSSLQSASGV